MSEEVPTHSAQHPVSAQTGGRSAYRAYREVQVHGHMLAGNRGRVNAPSLSVTPPVECAEKQSRLMEA